ncbi:MAG: molybdopterin-dependent oxidoreductase [Bacteroidota bacterium]
MTPPPSRRAFLKAGGTLLAGMALVPLAGCEFNELTPKSLGDRIPFLTPVGTDEGAFFVQNGGLGSIPGWSEPDLDPATWTLTIDGLVDTPLTLTLADLEAEASVTVLKTIRCVVDSNEFPGLIGTALWQGVPLRRFLDAAGVDRTRARRLHLFGADGFRNNVRLDEVYRTFSPDTFEPLLVTRMNGEPLTRAHGRPVRLLVYDGYGYRNVKWLERIEATADDRVFGTYQEVLGYFDEGTVRVASKVTDPVFAQQIPAGQFLIQGFAVSGATGVTQVEVAIDDGPFEPAGLTSLSEVISATPSVAAAQQVIEAGAEAFPFPGVWVQWAFEWTATPGPHVLRVRATDASGAVQPADDFTFEDGFNPIVEIRVTVT